MAPHPKCERPRVIGVVGSLLVLTACAGGANTTSAPSTTAHPAAVPGPSTATTQASSRTVPVGQGIGAILESGSFTGAALVVRAGEVLYRDALGFADVEAGERNTPETRFKLASIYKQLSAGLILTFARDGLIDLDGSLCQSVADCPDSLAEVTYHQVLTHTSGIGELTDDEGMQIQSNEDALRIIGDKQRLFEPGTGWSYSTTAYSLFTAIPELLMGKPLGEIELERLYGPAGMDHTALDGFEGLPVGAAVGYTAGGSLSGDTVGNWSTVDDLLAWHRALLGGDLIPSDLVALMEKQHVQVEDSLWYGYGVEVRETFGRREISHRGGTEGFNGYLIRLPDDDVVIALLSNSESTDVDVLREQLIDLVFANES